MSESSKFWVSREGQNYGPYSLEELKTYVEQGHFSEEDSACEANERANWKSVGDFTKEKKRTAKLDESDFYKGSAHTTNEKQVRTSNPSPLNAYLRAALPDEYPVGDVPLSLKMGDAQRKEILFQQGKFLEMAEAQFPTAPCSAFLAALKHDQLFEAFDISSTVFHELQDKEYFSKVEAVSRRLLSNSDSSLDEETKQNLRRLVAIQVYFSDILACQTVVVNALTQGIKAFEPPMTETGCRGCLSIIGVSILIILVSKLTDLEAEGFAYLVLLVGGIIWGIKMSPIWEKVKAFNKLRNKYYLHANRFETDLGWDSRTGATDLAQAAEFLKSLQSERVLLEDRYIEPDL